MHIESKGVLAVDLEDKGFLSILKEIYEHEHEIAILRDELCRITLTVETNINQRVLHDGQGPLSIKLDSEPARKILEQIGEHINAISKRLNNLEDLTACVETEINQTLTMAT